MAESLWGIEDNRIDNLEIDLGVCYWRVTAIDAFGLPGQMSTVRRFEIRNDTTPPFLRILAPEPKSIVRKAEIAVSGETEPLASLQIDGQPVAIDEQGRFSHEISASEGESAVTLVAVDTAGNETVRKIEFQYLKDDQRAIVYSETLVRDDEARFLTASDTLTISGTAAGGAMISVFDGNGALRSETYAAPTGAFLVNIPVEAAEETLVVRSTAVSGYAYESLIENVLIDFIGL